MELSELSRKRLQGVHPDLIKVVETAAENSSFEILIVDGLRSVETQRKYVAQGKSTTMNSRHLTGHACDLCAMVDGNLVWGKPYNRAIVELMKAAAVEHDVSIEAGADWRTFVDFPHFQLAWQDYPKQDDTWQQKKAPVEAVKQVAKKAAKAPVSAPVAVGGILALMLDKMQNVIDFLLATATQLTTLAPVSDMFAQAGANAKAITIGGIVLASSVVLKKVIEDD